MRYPVGIDGSGAITTLDAVTGCEAVPPFGIHWPVVCPMSKSNAAVLWLPGLAKNASISACRAEITRDVYSSASDTEAYVETPPLGAL